MRNARSLITFFSGGASAPGYPLDGYTNIRAAYSVRRLLTAYTGNALRLRRVSDSAESDFGFDANGDLDVAAIATWIGASSALVSTWYDQSGNGNNATEASNRPGYVASGINSKPTVSLNASGAVQKLALPASMLASLSACTALAVFQGDASPAKTSNALFGLFASGEFQLTFEIVIATGVPIFIFGGTTDSASNKATSGVGAVVANAHIWGGKAANGSPIKLYIDGTEVSSYTEQDNAATLKSSFTNTPAIGQRRVGDITTPAEGQLSELIIFSDAKTDPQISAISANQKTYYNI